MKRIFIAIVSLLIATPAAAESLGSLENNPTAAAQALDLAARLQGHWLIVRNDIDSQTGIAIHIKNKNINTDGAYVYADNKLTLTPKSGAHFAHECAATLPTGSAIECRETLGDTGWYFTGSMTAPHRYDGTLITPNESDNAAAVMIKVH